MNKIVLVNLTAILLELIPLLVFYGGALLFFGFLFFKFFYLLISNKATTDGILILIFYFIIVSLLVCLPFGFFASTKKHRAKFQRFLKWHIDTTNIEDKILIIRFFAIVDALTIGAIFIALVFNYFHVYQAIQNGGIGFYKIS